MTFRSIVSLWFVFLLSCGTVQAAHPVAHVTGGGTADFQDTPNALNTKGFTNFGVGAFVNSDGSAQGRFVCQIPGVVVISGMVHSGQVNPDGSVTFLGLANGYDSFIPGPYSGLPFRVTLRPGGPGVGGFDYRDESGFFGAGQFDTEVVRRGMIGIRK